MKHNRSLNMMEKIDKIIKWPQIETIVMKHYPVGNRSEGADLSACNAQAEGILRKTEPTVSCHEQD